MKSPFDEMQALFAGNSAVQEMEKLLRECDMQMKSLFERATASISPAIQEQLRASDRMVQSFLAEHNRTMETALVQAGSAAGLLSLTDRFRNLAEASDSWKNFDREAFSTVGSSALLASAAVKQWGIFDSTAFANAGSSALLATVEALRERSPLADYLASDESGFTTRTHSQYVRYDGPTAVSMRSSIAEVIDGEAVELEREMVQSLRAGRDVSTWSDVAKARFVLILHLLWILMVFIATESAVRQELCFFQSKLAPFATANQAGKAVRAFMCEVDAPVEYLRGFRVVDGTDVRLRSGPGMKHEILRDALPDRAVLKILDNSDRGWLYVSVVTEPDLEGWVSRRYTRQLLR